MYALMHPEYVASKEQWLVHCMRIFPYMEGTSFWEMVKSNLWDGQLYSLSLGLELWTFLPDIGSLYAGYVVGAQGDCLSIRRSTGRFGQGPLLSG